MSGDSRTAYRCLNSKCKRLSYEEGTLCSYCHSSYRCTGGCGKTLNKQYRQCSRCKLACTRCAKKTGDVKDGVCLKCSTDLPLALLPRQFFK